MAALSARHVLRLLRPPYALQARSCANQLANEALLAAARHPNQQTIRRCVDAIAAVPEAESFWAQQAVEEEELQLQHLATSLPKGGRLVPGLLEHVSPSNLPATEEVTRLLPRILGAREGLTVALRWRLALLAASAPRHGFGDAGAMAAERLERRLQRLLALWFHEGFLRTIELEERSKGNISVNWTKCYALTFPQMTEATSLTPLATLKVMLGSADDPTEDPMMPKSGTARLHEVRLCEEALRGFGMEKILLRQTREKLREQGFEILATVKLQGFRQWLRSHGRQLAQRPQFSQEVQDILAASILHSPSLRFTDLSGDDIAFHVPEKGQRGMEVSINGGEAKHVRRLKLQEDPPTVLILLEDGALQIDLPKEVDLLEVEKIGAFGGLLTPKMRSTILQLAFEYLFWPGEGLAANPDVHFHLSNGADFVSLHWRALESPDALAESFGLLATFQYQEDMEEMRTKDYNQHGVRAIIE
eukprot:symbB.v1.2.029750.t1/scaffold3292.1/size59590/1